MEDIRRVSIQDILTAREERAARQQAFLTRHAVPLISFTMNVAGEIKNDSLIYRAFQEGVSRIRRELDRMDAPVLQEQQTITFTGCEGLWAVQMDAQTLKKRMCLIEEADAIGRLFDVDVICADGSHLSRGAERHCLICGAPARVCARSRTHPAQALYEKTHEIIRAHFRDAFIRHVGEQAQRALLYEAITTPKPGLVDCENSGAHRDMDLFSFVDSACALRSYFERCVRMGMEQADVERLQYAGMLAEDEMISAAHANTHKGAVFSLGILCFAAGQCGENADMDAILHRSAQLGAYFLRQMKKQKSARTGGERQYLQYGLTGARGEAASGFESVRTIALPALHKALAEGKPLKQAGLYALLSLMAHVQDSNVIRRAGMEGQRWVIREAQEALQNGLTELRGMNERFVEQNLSPGGSADLLTVTYFLHFLQNQSEEQMTL